MSLSSVELDNGIRVLAFDQEFDVITCMEIFEHLDEIPLKKLHRALKPDGVLFVTVPVYDSMRYKWERITKKITKIDQAVKHDPTHVKAFSRNALVEIITQTGLFRVVQTKHYYDPVPIVRLNIPKLLNDGGMFLMSVYQRVA